MDQVLLAGCSFLSIESTYPPPPYDKILYDKYVFRGTPATGNRGIAARVAWELETKNYDHVVVLWSGINRVDIPVSLDEHEQIKTDYKFYSVLGNVVWYHSGGFAGTWQEKWSNCPEVIQQRMRERFLHATDRGLTDATLEAIIETQELLEARGISYDMSFIYDVDQSYNDTVDILGNRNPRVFAKDRWPYWLALEHCLGKIDRTSPLIDRINWSKFTAETPVYEYCLERDMLQQDKFHPNKDGIKQWFQTQLDIYLTS